MNDAIKGENYQYFSRDISWLSFNFRILMEAQDKSLPLFERLKFLSIYSSNLEEFFRVRVSEHRNKLADKMIAEEDHRLAMSELSAIHTEVSRQLKEYDAFFENEIIQELASNNIILYCGQELEPEHQKYVETYFMEEVFLYMEPMLVMKDVLRSFVRDNRIYIVVKVGSLSASEGYAEDDELYFILKVPYSKIPRFVELPSLRGKSYLMFAEDIIKMNLDYIFPGFKVLSAYTIRVSRDADFMIATETRQNMIEEIKKHVRKRKIGNANRLVYDRAMPSDVLSYICDAYGFEVDKCIANGSHLNLEDLIYMPNPVGDELLDSVPDPIRIADFDNSASMLDVIARGDKLLFTPYHSFNYFLRLLNELANDPSVEEIKLTQYRVASNSKVINALVEAARNGKKVTVFIEIKARFDEENNLEAAEKMRHAGVKIVYSLPGLKVHAKMLLATFSSPHKTNMSNLVCLSTGNFNEKTATIYSDIIVLSSDNNIAKEMGDLFTMLESGEKEYRFEKILVAQFNMIDEIRNLIDFEIGEAKAGRKARMVLKMNGLQDVGMINKLYEASQAGVEIDIIVRGICCLVPGAEFSANIKLTRIVDSYLEHARIWYFWAGGEEKVYVASADWMKRNLTRRIEAAFLIKENSVKRQIVDILKIQLEDNVKACWIDRELNNVYKEISMSDEKIRSQRVLYDYLSGIGCK